MSSEFENYITGPIVVGVSPSSGSKEALRWGAAEALYKKVPLKAVMAWRSPLPSSNPGVRPPIYLPQSDEELQAEAEAKLSEAIKLAVGPDHKIAYSAVRGSALNILLEASNDAQLLILDSPKTGSGVLAPSLLAVQLVNKSSCPIVMVPRSPSGTQSLQRAQSLQV